MRPEALGRELAIQSKALANLDELLARYHSSLETDEDLLPNTASLHETYPQLMEQRRQVEDKIAKLRELVGE